MSVGILYVLFEKGLFKSSAHFFNWVVLGGFLCVEFFKYFINFGH